MNRPREVIISITNRCNLKCRMCDIPSNRVEELSTSHWKQVIKDAASSGANAIVFSGGEPLLREDIFELITFTKNNSMGACLTSNGSLIQDDIARKLKQCGIDVVNISVEGPKRIHDYLRGRGMFNRATGALEILMKHKVEATVAATVSRYNYKYLPYVMEVAHLCGATTVKFQPFSGIFLSNSDRGEDFLISDREIKKLEKIINNIIELSRNYAISTNPGGYLATIPFYLAKKHIDISKGCAALENSCPINCNGDIYPCWVLTGKDNLLGNVREDTFLQIWGSKKHKAIIEKIKTDGCIGCMMSCYDDNFGKEPIKKRIVMSVKRLQKKGMREYTRGILKKWSKRIKFYSAYRGSFKGIVNRLRGSLRKNRRLNLELNREEIAGALKEIELAKQILETNLKNSK